MKKKLPMILTVAAACFGVFGAALRTHLLLHAYSPTEGFYTNSSLHDLLRYPLIGFVILAFVLAHIYIKEGKIRPSDKKTLPETIVSVAVAVIFTAFILFTAGRFLLYGKGNVPLADAFLCGFALLSLLYYLGEAKGKKSDEARALFCGCSACALLSMVFGLYFNASLSYANLTIALAYAAAIFTMLATVAEANAPLRRSAGHRYFSYAPVAVALTLTLAVPDLIYYVTARYAVLTNVFYDLLLLTLGIYHFVRLLVASVKTEED